MILKRLWERITNRELVTRRLDVIRMYQRWVDDLLVRGQRLADQLPPPQCKHCGSTKLGPDPGGYYIDAESWDGEPLLCMGKCRDMEGGHD